jgi:hypothetical protein
MWKVIIAAMLAAAASPAQHAHYRHDGKYALADRRVTPGVADPLAVADLSRARHIVAGIELNICAADFRTKPIRDTIRDFARLKKQACAEYGVSKCDKSVEGDHLVSLELGGCPDCLANIVPQPMDQARVKDDRVERVLPKLVCAGKLSLGQAQRCIAGDWVKCEKQLSASSF